MPAGGGNVELKSTGKVTRYYDTIAAANADAESGDTISLCVDYTIAGSDADSVKDGVTFVSNGYLTITGTSKFSAGDYTGNLNIGKAATAEAANATTLTTGGLNVSGSAYVTDGSTVTLSGNGFAFTGMFRDSVEDYNEKTHTGYTLNIQNADAFDTYGFYVNAGSTVAVTSVNALNTVYYNVYGGTVNLTDTVSDGPSTEKTINDTGTMSLCRSTVTVGNLNVYAGDTGKKGGTFTATDASTVKARFVNIGAETASTKKYKAEGNEAATMTLTDSTLTINNVSGEGASTITVGSANTTGILNLNNSVVDKKNHGVYLESNLNVIVGAKGTVNMAGGTLTADVITNNGTFKVSGTSKLNATSFAGDLTLGKSGETTTLTTDGFTQTSGTTNVFGDVTATGYNLDTVQVGYATGSTASDSLTMNGTGYTTNGIYIGQDSVSDREYALNLGGTVSATGLVYIRQNGTLNITDATVSGMNSVTTYGAMNLTNSNVTITAGTNFYITGRPTKSADGKASLTLDNSTLTHLNGYNGMEVGGGAGEGSGLVTLKNNSTLTTYKLNIAAKAASVTNDVKVVVDNSKLIVPHYEYMSTTNSTITIGKGSGLDIIVGANSEITTDAITNSGTITVDMSGATNAVYKLVDASADYTSDYGTYEFATGKANGYTLSVSNNDLLAINTDKADYTSLAVNAAWSTMGYGDEIIIGEGETAKSYYYGITAFSSATDLQTAITTDTTTIVAFGNYTGASVGTLAASQALTIETANTEDNAAYFTKLTDTYDTTLSNAALKAKRLEVYGGETTVDGGNLEIKIGSSSSSNWGLDIKNGTMTVENDADVSVTGNSQGALNVGSSDGNSTGRLNVTGEGSTFTVTASKALNVYAQGTLDVLNKAVVTVKGMWNQGTINMDVSGAQIVNTGDTWGGQGYTGPRTISVDMTNAGEVGTTYKLVDYQGSSYTTLTLATYGNLTTTNGYGKFSVGTGDDNGDLFVTVVNPVAQIGEVKYATLEQAFAAVQDGQTITLIADATLDNEVTIDKSITLDMAGYDVTVNYSYVFNVNMAAADKTFTITDSTYTAGNGIQSEFLGGSGVRGLISVNDYATIAANISLSNIAVGRSTALYSGTDTGGAVIFDGSTYVTDTLTLNNVNMYSANTLVTGNSSRASATLNVTGGTYDGYQGFRFLGGSSMIDSANITSHNGIAVYVYGGSATLKDSVVNMTATSNNDAVSATGSTTTLTIIGTEVHAHGTAASAVATANRSNITIKSGTFTNDSVRGDGKTYILKGNTTGGTLTMEDGLADGTGTWYAIMANTESKSAPDDDSKVIIKGGTVKGGSAGIALDSSDHAFVELAGGKYQGLIALNEGNVYEGSTNPQYVRITDDITLDVVNGGQISYSNAILVKGTDYTGEEIDYTDKKITADMTGATLDSYKLVDYTGSETKALEDYSMVELAKNPNSVYSLEVIDNDLYAVAPYIVIHEGGTVTYAGGDASAYTGTKKTDAKKYAVNINQDLGTGVSAIKTEGFVNSASGNEGDPGIVGIFSSGDSTKMESTSITDGIDIKTTGAGAVVGIFQYNGSSGMDLKGIGDIKVENKDTTNSAVGIRINAGNDVETNKLNIEAASLTVTSTKAAKAIQGSLLGRDSTFDIAGAVTAQGTGDAGTAYGISLSSSTGAGKAALNFGSFTSTSLNSYAYGVHCTGGVDADITLNGDMTVTATNNWAGGFRLAGDADFSLVGKGSKEINITVTGGAGGATGADLGGSNSTAQLSLDVKNLTVTATGGSGSEGLYLRNAGTSFSGSIDKLSVSAAGTVYGIYTAGTVSGTLGEIFAESTNDDGSAYAVYATTGGTVSGTLGAVSATTPEEGGAAYGVYNGGGTVEDTTFTSISATSASSDVYGIYADQNGTVTITGDKNSTISAVAGEGEGGGGEAYAIRAGDNNDTKGSITVTAGAISASSYFWATAVEANYGSSVSVTASSITATGREGACTYAVVATGDSTVSVDVNGGTITATEVDYGSQAYAIRAINNGNVTFVSAATLVGDIEIGGGGSITLASTSLQSSADKATLTFSGKWENEEDKLTVDMNGAEAAEYLLVDYTGTAETVNYGTVSLTNNTGYLVEVKNNDLYAVAAEAKIGDTYYATLQEAVNAALDGQTVTVLKDITLTSRVDVAAEGKEITIDLNEYTITRPDGSYSGNGSAFNVVNGNVTIENGTIDLTNLTQTTAETNECDAVTVRSGATVNLTNMNIQVNSITGACAYAFDGGTVNVNGGTYKNLTTEAYPYGGDSALIFNQANTAGQKIFVNAGTYTFVGKDPAKGDDSSATTGVTTFVASDVKASVKVGDVTTYCTTFADAMAVATTVPVEQRAGKDSVTVTLLNDAEVAGYDFNGDFTGITIVGTEGTKITGDFGATGGSSVLKNVTFKNLNFVGSKITLSTNVTDYTNFTINGCTMDGTGAGTTNPSAITINRNATVPADGIQIINNTIKNYTNSGANGIVLPNTQNTSSNVMISGNTISNVANNAIQAQKCIALTIKDNVLSNADGNVLNLYGTTSATIDGNTITLKAFPDWTQAAFSHMANGVTGNAIFTMSDNTLNTIDSQVLTDPADIVQYTLATNSGAFKDNAVIYTDTTGFDGGKVISGPIFASVSNVNTLVATDLQPQFLSGLTTKFVYYTDVANKKIELAGANSGDFTIASGFSVNLDGCNYSGTIKTAQGAVLTVESDTTFTTGSKLYIPYVQDSEEYDQWITDNPAAAAETVTVGGFTCSVMDGETLVSKQYSLEDAQNASVAGNKIEVWAGTLSGANHLKGIETKITQDVAGKSATIYGGNYMHASGKGSAEETQDTLVSTNVNITDMTSAPSEDDKYTVKDIYAGTNVDASNNDSGRLISSIATTNVTVSGANSKVRKIYGGSIVTMGGGNSLQHSATATVTTANVTVSGGASVETVIAGGRVYDDSWNNSPVNVAENTVTTANVAISDNANVGTVFGGGLYTFGSDPTTEGAQSTVSVGTSNITVSGTVGTIYAGGFVESERSGVTETNTVSVTVGTSTITLNTGAVVGNLYGTGYTEGPAVNGITNTVTTSNLVIDGNAAVNGVISDVTNITINSDKNLSTKVNLAEDGAIVTYSGSWTNSGTLTVDMSNATVGAYKLVDYTGTQTVTSYGDVKLTGSTDYQTVVVNNDLWAISAQPVVLPTLKVNAAWTTYEIGDAIEGETGYYYGINAFDKFFDALGVAEVNTSVSRIEVLSDTDEVIAKDYFITQDLTIGTNVKGGVVINANGGTAAGVFAIESCMSDSGSVTIESGVELDNVRQWIAGRKESNPDAQHTINLNGKMVMSQMAIWSNNNSGTTPPYANPTAAGTININKTASVQMGMGDGVIDFRDKGAINVTGTLTDTTDTTLNALTDDDKQLYGGYVQIRPRQADVETSFNLKNTFVDKLAWVSVNDGEGQAHADGKFALTMDNSALRTTGAVYLSGTKVTATLTNGSRLMVGTDLTLGTTATVTMDAKSSIEAVSVSNSGAITMDATSSIEAVSVSNSGAITMDAGALIAFSGDWNNATAITVDMSDADKNFYKLVDYTGTGSMTLADYGTVSLTGSSDYTTFVIGNDLYAVKAGEFTTSVTINSAYAAAGYEYGDLTVDNKLYGYNAFADLASAFTSRGSGTIENLTIYGRVMMEGNYTLGANGTLTVMGGATLSVGTQKVQGYDETLYDFTNLGENSIYGTNEGTIYLNTQSSVKKAILKWTKRRADDQDVTIYAATTGGGEDYEDPTYLDVITADENSDMGPENDKIVISKDITTEGTEYTNIMLKANEEYDQTANKNLSIAGNVTAEDGQIDIVNEQQKTLEVIGDIKAGNVSILNGADADAKASRPEGEENRSGKFTVSGVVSAEKYEVEGVMVGGNLVVTTLSEDDPNYKRDIDFGYETHTAEDTLTINNAAGNTISGGTGTVTYEEVEVEGVITANFAATGAVTIENNGVLSTSISTQSTVEITNSGTLNGGSAKVTVEQQEITKELAADFVAEGDVEITNSGHLNANIVTDNNIKVWENSSVNTLTGTLKGKTIEFSDNTGAIKDATLIAYGTSDVDKGFIEVVGNSDASTIEDSALYAGYSSDKSTTGNWTGAIKLYGNNTVKGTTVFNGNLSNLVDSEKTTTANSLTFAAGSDVTVNGDLTNAAGASMLIAGAETEPEAVDAAELAVTGALANNGTITVKGNMTVTGASSNTTGASMTVNGTLTVTSLSSAATGQVTINNGGLLAYSGTLSGDDSITVTAYTDGQAHKVIDWISGVVADYSTLVKDYNANKYYVYENDLYYNDSTVAYVNSNYTTELNPTGFTKDGHVVGVNAFTTFAAAQEYATTAGITLTKIVSTESRGEELYGTEATSTFSGTSTMNFNTVEFVGSKESTSYVGILGGQRLELTQSRKWTNISGEVNMTFKDGTFTGNVIGGTYMSGTGSVWQEGDINLTVNGGTFGPMFAGGMYYNEQSYADMAYLKGNINLSISGGTFTGYVIGGNISKKDDIYSARTTVEGDITIVIDATENAISFNKLMLAGSRYAGTVYGDTSVTLKGLGTNLNFNGNTLSGGCGADFRDTDTNETFSWVDGDRHLVFESFTGDLNARLIMFTDVTMTNSSVNLKETTKDSWLFEADTWTMNESTLTGDFGDNDFTGDTINLTFADSTTVFDAATADQIKGWKASSTSVNINGTAATLTGGKWVAGNYSFGLDDNDETKLVISKLA